MKRFSSIEEEDEFYRIMVEEHIITAAFSLILALFAAILLVGRECPIFALFHLLYALFSPRIYTIIELYRSKCINLYELYRSGYDESTMLEFGENKNYYDEKKTKWRGWEKIEYGLFKNFCRIDANMVASIVSIFIVVEIAVGW